MSSTSGARALGRHASPLTTRVAIVHDWLVNPGGGELVLDAMLEVFPQAQVFSLIDKRADVGAGGRASSVRTSWLQRVPGIATRYRSFLPLMPLAMRSLDVSAFDIVLCNSHAIAKGITTHERQLHLVYCLSPMRYTWDLRDQYLRESGNDRGVRGALARAMLERMRRWDERNTERVDAFATLSHYIADRIQRAYHRAAEVIFPPVDTEFFTPAAAAMQDAGYYVTASRLVPYKRLDMIAKAFALLPDRKLVIVGDGPDAKKVRAASGSNVMLVGRESRERVRERLRGARAFVFAAEEDFGIAPVEAQACGTPVIAYGKGGVLETVRGLDAPDPTGVFYAEQTPASLADAVRRFEALGASSRPISADACRENALRFRGELFRDGLREWVGREWERFASR